MSLPLFNQRIFSKFSLFFLDFSLKIKSLTMLRYPLVISNFLPMIKPPLINTKVLFAAARTKQKTIQSKANYNKHKPVPPNI